jgi:hypothetical protein
LAMASLSQKIDCERQTRDFLEENGLPQPDSVEYGFTCIRLLFHDPKLVLVIDIDEPPEDARSLHLNHLEQEED